MNVFCEVFYAIAGVKKYPEFLKNKKGKVFGYVTLVVFLFILISQLLTIPNTMDFVKEAQETLMEFPDFAMEDGVLEMEESFYLEEGDLLIMIESEYGAYINEYQTAEWYATLEDYESVLIMDQTTLLLKDEGAIDIYDYPVEFNFDRDDVYGLIEYAYVFVAIYLVFAFIFSLMGYFLFALLVALVGMIMCSFMNQKLTFGQLYLLALYAKTLPHLIKGVFNLIGISFFGFSVIGFAVACLYLGFAIHHMDMLDEEQKKVDGPIIFN